MALFFFFFCRGDIESQNYWFSCFTNTSEALNLTLSKQGQPFYICHWSHVVSEHFTQAGYLKEKNSWMKYWESVKYFRDGTMMKILLLLFRSCCHALRLWNCHRQQWHLLCYAQKGHPALPDIASDPAAPLFPKSCCSRWCQCPTHTSLGPHHSLAEMTFYSLPLIAWELPLATEMFSAHWCNG